MALTRNEIATMAELMTKMEEEDFSIVREMYNTASRNRQVRAGAAFHPKDQVYFTSNKTGAVIYGTVEKINTKTVKVRADSGALWTVSPSMLKMQ